MKKLLELKSVGKTYHLGKKKVRALRDINLSISKGEFVSIIGPSGSGKSTLLHLMGLMDQPDRGTMVFEENVVKKLSETELARFRLEKIGFVFQDFNLMEDFTVEENIALPLLIKSGKNFLTATEKQKMEQILEKLELTDRRNHKPNQISGGQKQRTAIGRALIGDPELLLADEPTGDLDMNTSAQIIEILSSLCAEEKLTLIIVTHDHQVAARAHRIIQLIDGRISTKSQS